MGVVLNIVFIVGLLVLAAGLVLRVVPLSINDIRFRETEIAHASATVGQYAEGTFEGIVGYPSGLFVVDDKATSLPTTIVLKEAQPAGAVTDSASAAIMAMGGNLSGAGCGPALIGFLVLIFIGAPFFAVSVLDRVCRKVMQSKIVITVAQHESDSIVKIKLHGLSAGLCRKSIMNAFAEPQLPEEFVVAAVVSQPEPMPSPVWGPPSV